MTAGRRSWLIVGALLSVLAMNRAVADEPAGANDGLLRVTGKVLLPGGSPATGATVESLTAESGVSRTTRTDDAGSFELYDLFGDGLRLYARSPDGSYQGQLSVAADAVRTTCAAPVAMMLTPADRHEVLVVCEGRSVPDARVLGLGTGFRVEGVTDAGGSVVLQIPSDGRLTQLIAWHPERGVEGLFRMAEDPTEMTKMSLRAPAPYKVRAVDPVGNGVPNVAFGISGRTRDSSWMAVGDIREARARTDADGIAIVSWLPSGFSQAKGLLDGTDWHADRVDLSRVPDGLMTIQAQRMSLVEGRLLVPEGTRAEGILVLAKGLGSSGYQLASARAARDGSFRLRLCRDYCYAVGVVDFEWASDLLTRTIEANEEPVAPLRIQAYPATPITIRVTRGEQHEPVAGARLDVGARRSVAQLGKKVPVGIVVAPQLETDRDGIARTGVGRGEIRCNLFKGDWIEERTLDVQSSEPLNVNFYRPWVGDRQVTGQLTVDGQPFEPSSTLQVVATAGLRMLHPEVGPGGAFQLAFDADNALMLVVDREQQRSALVQFDGSQARVDIAMQPTASFSGTLLDEESKPIANRKLEVWCGDRILHHIAVQSTDEGGNFRFSGLPANVRLGFALNNQGEAAYRLESGTQLFSPGEIRTENAMQCARIGAKKPLAPLAERLADVGRNARLARMRPLLVLQGDDSKTVAKLSESMLDGERLRAVYSYLPIALTPEQIKTEAEALGKLAWPLPAAGEIVLLVLGEDSGVTASERIKVEDADAALASSDALLKQYRTPAFDAQQLVKQAREQAAGSGRRVWVLLCGPRCGPCFRLARWLDEHHATLEKDYVVVKVMWGLDDNVEPVFKELPGRGVPWYAITEADGKALVTSESPLGNIGMPGSKEDLRYFRSMFERTAKHLTSQEIGELMQSLPAN